MVASAHSAVAKGTNRPHRLSLHLAVAGLAVVLVLPTWAWAEGFSWWPGKKKVDTTASMNIYSQQAKHHNDRGLNAPALGHENKEPGRIRKFATSVVDKTKDATHRMSAAVKRGARKTTAAFRSDETVNANDPLSLSAPPVQPNASFYVSVAQMQERSGNLEAAEQNYRQALKEEPQNLEALLDYAHLYDRQNRLAEATALYRTAIQYHPDSARAHNDLGICLARQELLLESHHELEEAVRLEPQRKLYRNNLAKVLVKSNRAQEAFAQLAQVHTPSIAHYNMGYLLFEQSNLQGAEYHFQQAAIADPQFVAARQWCDRLAMQRGVAPGAGHPALAQRPVPAAYPQTVPATPTSYGPGVAPVAPGTSGPLHGGGPGEVMIDLPPGAGR